MAQGLCSSWVSIMKLVISEILTSPRRVCYTIIEQKSLKAKNDVWNGLDLRDTLRVNVEAPTRYFLDDKL